MPTLTVARKDGLLSAERGPLAARWDTSKTKVAKGRCSRVAATPSGILERAKGFEPSTPTLARLCSTPELHPRSAVRLAPLRGAPCAPSGRGLQGGLERRSSPDRG